MRFFVSADFDENSLKSLVILFSCCCCELAPSFLWSIVVWLIFENEMPSICLRNLVYPWRPELLPSLVGNKQCFQLSPIITHLPSCRSMSLAGPLEEMTYGA